MKEVLQSFLDFIAAKRNYSPNTTEAYRNDLSQFLAFITSHYPSFTSFQNVRSEIIDEYVAVLQARPYAASTVARKAAAIKSFFHYLFAKGLILRDPSIKVETPRVEKLPPETLPADKIELLLAAPSGGRTPKRQRDQALLSLLYATGIRVSEAVSLLIDDVDLPAKWVTCRMANGASRRIALDDDARRLLASYIDDGRKKLLKRAGERSLFLNHRGKQLTRQGLWLIIKTYADELDLGAKVTPHTLRHSFAEHKMRGGARLKDLQKMLGHANISTTQVYSHMRGEKN